MSVLVDVWLVLTNLGAHEHMFSSDWKLRTWYELFK